MNPKVDAIRRSVRDLKTLLERETRMLAQKKLSALADLTKRKAELTASLESFLMTGLIGVKDDRLLADLQSLNEKASENAAQLAAIRQGFADAKARLEALTAAEKRSGLYAAEGRDMRVRSVSAIGRNV
jgi:flagellar biosynthesis/type III secretory pathway chaperone